MAPSPRPSGVYLLGRPVAERGVCVNIVTFDSLRRLMRRRRFFLAIDLLLLCFAQIVLLGIVIDWNNSRGVATTIALSLVYGAIFLIVTNVHSQVWKRVSLTDMISLAAAAVFVAFATALTVSLMTSFAAFTRVFAGGAVTYACAWAAPRVLWRLAYEQTLARRVKAPSDSEPVLIYGGGQRAEQFITLSRLDRRYNVVGVLTDDGNFGRRRLRGVPVSGRLADLPAVVGSFRERGVEVTRLIVAEDGESRHELADALDAAASNGLILCRLPSMLSLVQGGQSGDIVKPVAIDDILHRDQVCMVNSGVRESFGNRVVLVTGAGGSIGSELVRQIAACGPARLILVEFSEFNLYQIDLELKTMFPHVPAVACLCDIRDRAALGAIFDAERPELVLHAAALKHVPLLEANAAQAVLTNVLGTVNVAELARDFGVKVMTLVSTDKAVNPANVMGCTKRWAEIACQTMDMQSRATRGGTRFACVRFGNVLDSAGSVVPLFRRQIASGGPVTVTHPDITRYFMTIPEASELILMAAAETLVSSPASSQAFVLDMGEPVRIMDLAERMIQLHGLRPHVDIELRHTGLRPGEKLYEELAHAEETLMPASFPKAHLVEARCCSPEEFRTALAGLKDRARGNNPAAIVAALRVLVPEFVYEENAAGRDQEIVAAQ